jgi:hypothetical protein
MTLPFTVEQFFQVFADYNVSIWPIQIVAYVLALVTLALAFRPGAWSDRFAAGVLGTYWIWMGVVYHIMYFSPINPAAFVFGAFFVAQGLLFWYVGAGQRLSFEFAARPAPLVGTLFILYAMVGYPLLSTMLGHSYPATPTFGVAPCPTTIFTFGLLLWATPSLPRYLLIIPFLWSLIGTTAAITLDVPADYGLGIAGIIGVVMIVFRHLVGSGHIPQTT